MPCCADWSRKSRRPEVERSTLVPLGKREACPPCTAAAKKVREEPWQAARTGRRRCGGPEGRGRTRPQNSAYGYRIYGGRVPAKTRSADRSYGLSGSVP